MKTILIMIFRLFASSVFAAEIPTWTHNPERSEDGFSIVHTVTGYGHNRAAAIITAKGIFLERILKECNSLHKAALITHTYARKQGDQFVSHASGTIAKSVCAYSKKLPKAYRDALDSDEHREMFLKFNLYYTMLKMGLKPCSSATQCYEEGVKATHAMKFYKAVVFLDEACVKGHATACKAIPKVRLMAKHNYD